MFFNTSPFGKTESQLTEHILGKALGPPVFFGVFGDVLISINFLPKYQKPYPKNLFEFESCCA